jgi:RHS repeat-associated protein
MTNTLRLVVSSVIVVLALSASGSRGSARQEAGQVPRAAGQTATPLSNGSILLLGGEGTAAEVLVYDPATRRTRLAGRLVAPRSWHTATVMPDGTVLVAGGIGDDGQIVPDVERFDPATGKVAAVPDSSFTPRAHHTATLLTDGRVLFAGGDTPGGGGLRAELWDARTNASDAVSGPPLTDRFDGEAQLLPDGRVRIAGGRGKGRNVGGRGVAQSADVFDPEVLAFVDEVLAARVVPLQAEGVAAVLPGDQATGVSQDVRVSLRLTTPIDAQSLVVTMEALGSGAPAPLPATIVTAEGGRLVFLTPASALPPDTDIRVTLRTARTVAGRALPAFSSVFRTASAPDLVEPRSTPDDRPAGGRNALESPWRKLPPLQAQAGVTALAGQVLLLNGAPLADVTLAIGQREVRTDRTGRFLLRLGSAPSGWRELLIDGTTANHGRRTYGLFEVAVQIVGRKTAPLPYTIWMPTLDTAHAVRIPSPTVKETVITTPRIPGLELHLPANTVVRDHHGKIVREISITPIPIAQPPFPLPTGVAVPAYFTIQPGGAYIYTSGAGPKGGWLVYPNYSQQPPGTAFNFWNYDSEEKGWHVYGLGRVTPDGRQVAANPYTRLYEFTGAMFNYGQSPGPPGGNGPEDGEPVDLSTGEFVTENADLTVQDVMPLALVRTYRTGDSGARPFGIGSTHPYAMFLWSANQWTEVDLVLPDGKRIHYVRTSSGTSWTDAAFEHTATPTAFYKSTIVLNGNGWDLRLKDGTTYFFGGEAPLQSIRDRFGNTVTLTYSSTTLFGFGIGNIVRVTSSNGRWIGFTYDGSNRIIEAKDNIGRTVGYQYDGSGRVWKVTDARGGVTEYTYDIAHRMLTIKDPRNIVFLDNDYDVNGRVEKQTQADGGEYAFDYTVNGGGQITQTDVTNPRGYVRRVAFNSDRFMTSDTSALGEAIEQTTSYTRLATSNLVESETDELGRVTHYTYDSKGNVASVTRLHGTVDAVTTTYTSDATYNLPTSMTDPLNHTTTLAYDGLGRIQSSTNALSHQTVFTTNIAGQVLSVTDPLSRVTELGYADGDLVSVETPLGHTVTRFTDAAGRLISVTDATGARTRFVYDAHDQITKITDPKGGETTFTYDGNGNLLTFTDARNKTTTWTYDDMDRVETRTDPLSRDESFAYDLKGNLVSRTDRKGQVTTYQYDALDRQTFVGFGTTGAPPTYASIITATYDAGDRVTDIVDSVAGTIERTYDLLDRLTEEVTPEGTVSYTHDDADRRATMTVAGQTAVSYTYDNADRLTGVTRGAASVTVSYDNASKRTSLTLPNGIVVEYAYDDDSRLTGLTYKLGMSTLGTLTYAYDGNGQRTSVSGTYARTGLPAALASATYDDANQVATFGAASFTYDDNGNLTSDGVRSYTWNARDQLASLTGPVNGSFAYDGFGRRRAKTVGGTTTQFLYDGVNPTQELSGGTPTANLLTGLGIDEFFTRTDSAGVRNYFSDALGSSVALADGSGTVQTEYSYEPFGGTSASGASNTNSFTYTGRESDGTGLHYYRARYYHPTGQRFIAEDPLGFDGGDVNLYGYALQNPVNLTDPLGLQAVPIPVPLPGPVIAPFPWGAGGREVPQDLLPPIDEFAGMSRKIHKPKKPRCGCACLCRADADETMPGNIQPGWPRFAFGFAIASSCEKASKEAKRKATQNLGMKPKHIPCECTGR